MPFRRKEVFKVGQTHPMSSILIFRRKFKIVDTTGHCVIEGISNGRELSFQPFQSHGLSIQGEYQAISHNTLQPIEKFIQARN